MQTTKLKREETGSYFRVPFTCASSLLSAEPGTGYLLISYSILLPVIYKWDLGSIDIYFLCPEDELSMTQYYYGNLSPSLRRRTRKNIDILRTKQVMIQVKFPLWKKKLKKMRRGLFTVPDPGFEIRGGGGGSVIQILRKRGGGGRSPTKSFWALRGSVWCKNKIRHWFKPYLF